MDTPTRRRGVVGPVLLILLGIGFLFNNLGLLSWSFWELLFRLWPVWLIAVGLDILVGRRYRWGGWAVLAVTLAILGGALLYEGALGGQAPAPGAELEGTQISQPLEGVTRANVTISPGVGRLTIGALTDSTKLIEGTITRWPGESISKDASGSDGAMRFRLETRGTHFSWPFGSRQGGRWDLRLNPQVPIELDLNTGVGDANIDLSQLKLTGLSLDSGVGSVKLTLPQTGQFRAKINSGVGEITIYVPKGMAARVRIDTGIGAARARGNFERQGSYYVTPGYDNAVNRVELDVDGGVGSINIEEISAGSTGQA